MKNLLNIGILGRSWRIWEYGKLKIYKWIFFLLFFSYLILKLNIFKIDLSNEFNDNNLGRLYIYINKIMFKKKTNFLKN